MRKKIYTLTCALMAIGGSINSTGQTITTLAGTGIATYGGDSGPASAADLNNPYGVAVNTTTGDVYIADHGNHRIRKVNGTTGVITTIAGTGVGGYIASQDGGPATAAQIQFPRGITVDPAGNVVFSDYGNNRIRKINTTTGIITTIAGVGGAPSYVASEDGGMATAAHLAFAWGVAYDAAGNLYLADNQNCRVRKVNTSGIITTVAGNGTCFISGDGGQATDAKLQYPTGVALDAAGNLYIADDGNNRVRKVALGGIISTIAGSPTYGFTGDGGPSTAARLYYPRGIAVDGPGNVFITDMNNNRIRKINVFGVISTIAGNGAATFGGDGGVPTAASIAQPTGFAADPGRGKYYICDNDNNRIRVITIPHSPSFDGGRRQTATLCEGASKSLDTLLAINDIDVSQTETWTLLTPALHGTALASFVTTSTGGTVTPLGTVYTSSVGYSGLDSFTVRVTDASGLSDTTTIVLNILPLSPNAGVITGIDSVCSRFTVSLSATISGGVWSSSNTAIATVTGTGVVTGVAPGTDTIRYTVTNACGSGVAIFPILVRDTSVCPGVGTPTLNMSSESLNIFPNPNNGTFTIQVASANKEETEFVITNLLGEKVKHFTAVTNSAFEIKLNEQPAGIYYLSASNNHNKYVKKIVITK